MRTRKISRTKEKNTTRKSLRQWKIGQWKSLQVGVDHLDLQWSQTHTLHDLHDPSMSHVFRKLNSRPTPKPSPELVCLSGSSHDYLRSKQSQGQKFCPGSQESATWTLTRFWRTGGSDKAFVSPLATDDVFPDKATVFKPWACFYWRNCWITESTRQWRKAVSLVSTCRNLQAATACVTSQCKMCDKFCGILCKNCKSNTSKGKINCLRKRAVPPGGQRSVLAQGATEGPQWLSDPLSSRNENRGKLSFFLHRRACRCRARPAGPHYRGPCEPTCGRERHCRRSDPPCCEIPLSFEAISWAARIIRQHSG